MHISGIDAVGGAIEKLQAGRMGLTAGDKKVGISPISLVESGWFYGQAQKGQNSVLPNKMVTSNPSESVPLELTPEEQLTTPVGFAINVRKKIMICLSIKGAASPQEIVECLSGGSGMAVPRERPRHYLEKLIACSKRTRSASFHFEPSDRPQFLIKNGISAMGARASVNKLLVTWEVKKFKDDEYTDLSADVEGASHGMQDLNGQFTECEIIAVDSDGTEVNFDLFEQFLHYQGTVSFEGRHIEFTPTVAFLREAIRSLEL
jgi:hypothetical protein